MNAIFVDAMHMTIPQFLMFAVPGAMFLGAALAIVVDKLEQRRADRQHYRSPLASCGCFYCR